MKRYGSTLVGDEEHFSFEARIFNFVILLGIFMSVFGTIMDVYYKAPIFIDLAFVGLWILTYFLVRYKGHFHVVSVVSISIFVFVFIPYNWISSGGSGGVLPYYTIAFIVILCVLFKGYFRIVMVFSMLAIELLLIAYDACRAGSYLIDVREKVSIADLSIHLFVIMVSMAILIIVYSNTYMKEKARSELYAKTIEEQYRQQFYYMESLEQLNYKLKSERHDYNNNLGVLYGLLENGEAQEARDYAKRLIKNAEEYQTLVNIPYSMIRAMLNYKLSAIRENGIELRLDIAIPEGLPLNEHDLSVILGNLLDNAAEACVVIKESPRYIALKLLYKPDYLIIQVENPVNRESVISNGENRTTKPDAENHGFGLSNIEYLVNKHNGLIKIQPDNGVFKVDIALLVD